MKKTGQLNKYFKNNFTGILGHDDGDRFKVLKPRWKMDENHFWLGLCQL